uniref:Pleckstrin homology domain containing, family G (with RhoGef domain) member 2 n=1 Tax=Cyclopterus lumpus TaxID=8103 RepID=A0A8C2WW62_CYCLU
MMSSGERGASSSSCTSVNTVCSDGERPASLSLSSSASSVSLQDTSHSSSSSSSSSLPYGAVPTYSASSSSSTPKRNGSDISLDLTPLVTPCGGGAPGGGGGACVATGGGNHPDGHGANQVAAAPRQLSRLERVVLEIVETEQAYVRDLKSIVEDYLGSIIDCGSLPLKPEQVSTLFCNVEDIYEFNSDLLEDLERSPHAVAIAECFVERSEAFDIYTLYCMNYPNSVAVLRDCMKNESLVPFFQERQTTLNHSLPLETYLLKPVQRILKYHLLLQELSKHFDKSDPKYEVIEDAIITMTAVAWYINDMKRKQEHAERLQEIESLLVNWSGPDLGGFGELVLEGSFRVHRVKKERAFFLFDTMLLIAKKRLELFVYSTHIFCCNLLLVETLKDSLCFKVSDHTIPKQQHVVQTRNQEEKRLWVHYLKRLIVENHPASLPQKARQVLGDHFCQTPQFHQDDQKKASPRPDDLHGFHRGRRQSEPPELLMYTPEKSRKSLPLLLEGNLPYRRSRRQSAPAKDIAAAFHPKVLQPADTLDSAGSSVMEVEADSTTQRPEREEEEGEDEEELTPLSPPSTLSITEEILEFINQSRARDGLSAIYADTPEYELDQPKESQPPSIQNNFTCPLPPAACPSSPEQRPTMHQEQETAETENDSIYRSPTGGPGEEIDLESERMANEVQEIQEAASKVEKGVEVGEGAGDVLGKEEEEEEEEKTKDEGEIITHASDLHPSHSAEEEIMSCESLREEVITETTTSSPNPNPPHPPTQRDQPRGSHLTKRDKKIIEKIRSYYEAAAEAEEDEAEEVEEQEDERGDGVAQRRSGSFSQIPSGLVKESVSRFDLSGHQEEPESGRCKCDTMEGINGEADPEISGFTQLAELENDVQEEKPIHCLDFDADGQTSPEIQAEETANQVNLQSSRPVEEKADKLGKNRKVCRGPSEEFLEEQQTSVVAIGDPGEDPCTTKQYRCTEEPIKTSAGNPVVMNGHEPNRAGLAEPNGSHKEPPTPLQATEQCQKTEAETQSTWTTSKHRDLERTSGNLEGLPSQIKVGRWSRRSRIVTANRVLFESMGSDVAGIGLFETSPVVDPMLMENSERILSKVQTLACMYSAKASTMKVPLHQKRASNVWNQSWGSGRLSGYSTQTQTEGHLILIPTQIQNPTKYRQQTQYQEEVVQSETHSETKYGTQTHSETKVQSQTVSQIQTKNQMWSQTQYQSQNQIKTHSLYQTQTTSQEDRTIQEERTINRAESLTNDPQQTPSGPLLVGHASVKEQPASHRQTNGVRLSRPRDFISALTKERNCGSIDGFQTSTSPGESPPRHLRGFTSSEDRGTGLWRSASNSPPPSTVNLDCGVTRGGALDPTGEVYKEREKRGRSSSSTDAITRPTDSEPSLSAQSKAPWEFSRDGEDLQDSQRDIPECNSSTGQTCNEDVFTVDGEAPGGELVLSPAESTSTQSPAGFTSTQSPAESTSTQSPAESTSTQSPAESIFTQSPAEPTSTQSPAESISTQSPAESTSTQSPAGFTSTQSPAESTSTQSPAESISTQSPAGFTSTQSPAESTSTQSPAESTSTQSPAESTSTQSPAESSRARFSEEESNSSWSQTRMLLHGSSVIFTESCYASSREHLGQHSTFDPWRVPGDTEVHGAGAPSPEEVHGVGAPSPEEVHEAGQPSPEEVHGVGAPSPEEVHGAGQPSPEEVHGAGAPSPEEVHGVGVPSPEEVHGAGQPSPEEVHGAGQPSPEEVHGAGAPSPEEVHGVGVPSPEEVHGAGQPSPEEVHGAGAPSPEEVHGAGAPSPEEVHGSHPADRLPTFTSQRPQDLQAAPKRRAPADTRDSDHQDSRSPTGRPSSRSSSKNLLERQSPATAPPGPDADPSAFRPSLRQRSPSPVRALPPSSSSSVRAPPCSSPFRVVPASSPSSASAGDTSLNTVSRALPCFSPTPSPGRGSSSGRSPSMRASPLSSPPHTSPVASSCAFTRSLAASCISQSISQSMAKKNSALQQAPPTNQSPSSTPSLPSSHLRRRSPSPKPPPGQQGSSTPAYAQLGCPKDGYQHPRGPLSSLWSSCPPPSLSQRSPSPSMTRHHQPSPRPAFLHSKSDSNANNNNNNNSNVSFAATIGNEPLASGSTNAAVVPQTADPLWSGSHNRVARPFSASEPSSRVQSPLSPSPTPASFTRLCSQPPQHDYTSPMANKPPHPRSTRAGGASSHNPLGLTLEMPRSAFGQTSPCLSPRILSPPPIGVPMNVWTNNVAAPQPRNPKYPSSSPSLSFSSRGSPTLENESLVASQTLRRSHSSNMADRPPSPARSSPGGARRSSSSSLSHTLLSSPVPSDSQSEWADPEIQEGTCRSQLICAYVARPSSSCMLRSTSPPPPSYQHHHYQSTMPPPLPPSASPVPFDLSPPTKQGNQKTSYATTVNLRIAGSGRITSFSTAQVSLTQTLQGGAGGGGPGPGPGPEPGPGQSTRRISINGLSHIPSTLSQNCDRM